MNFSTTVAIFASALSASAAVKKGSIEAELVTASTTYQAGVPVEAALVLRIDDGWHTYWLNPGEGGMAPTVEWTLPDGWKAGDFGWPVPERFSTGGLFHFGYSGQIVVPVTLTPPGVSSDVAQLEMKLDWLSCSATTCVPGEATLTFVLRPGPADPTSADILISAARKMVPRPMEEVTLEVVQKEKALELKLRLPPGVDGAELQSFPLSRSVIDPGASYQFSKSGEVWTAEVPSSEYLDGDVEALELILNGGGLPHPVRVEWFQNSDERKK